MCLRPAHASSERILGWHGGNKIARSADARMRKGSLMKRFVLAVGLALCLIPNLCSADVVLYNNGADTLFGGWYLGSPGASSDDFQLSSASTVNSITFSLWQQKGNSLPTQVYWTISTGVGGTGMIDSGTGGGAGQFGAVRRGPSGASRPGPQEVEYVNRCLPQSAAPSGGGFSLFIPSTVLKPALGFLQS